MRKSEVHAERVFKFSDYRMFTIVYAKPFLFEVYIENICIYKYNQDKRLVMYYIKPQGSHDFAFYSARSIRYTYTHTLKWENQNQNISRCAFMIFLICYIFFIPTLCAVYPAHINV